MPTLNTSNISHFIQRNKLGFQSSKMDMFQSLEESLSITTGRCDLAIATHAKKMHKNLFAVVHPEVLDND